MNKYKIFAFLGTTLLLTGCFTPNGEDSTNSESKEPVYVVDRYLVDNRDIEYSLGETYNIGKRNNYYYVIESSDGSKSETELERIYEVTHIYNKEYNYSYTDLVFASAGVHEVYINFKVEGIDYNYPVRVDIKSGTEEGYDLRSFDISNDIAYTSGSSFKELNPNLKFEAVWNNTSGTVNEYIFSGHEDLNLNLTKEGSTTNALEETLVGGESYTLNTSLDGYSSAKYTETFNVSETKGYYDLEPTLVYEDFTSCAPHKGQANLLVVLIEFQKRDEESEYVVVDWNDEFLDRVDNYFFGEKEDTPNHWNSLKTYYHQASQNKLQISGMVSEIYEVPLDLYSIEDIYNGNGNSYKKVHECYREALKWIQDNNPEVDWSSYDLNNDGYFDNLHFINNTDYQTSLTEVGGEKPLWPHKWNMTTSRYEEMVNGDVYEQTCLGHFQDARTIIHEQGHVFGIPDYYDYSYAGPDYIGCLDMQSHNVFDWNAFSKFSVGWGEPIVVDGSLDSTTVKIKPSSTTNQCLVIPANHSTYNGSAFDEYFLIELFTCAGNNEYDWKEYFGHDSKKSAIKIFHVDARLYSYYYGELTDVDVAKQNFGHFTEGCNNSSNWRDVGGNRDWADYKLLALIQRGGIDTFGEKDGTGQSSYDLLTLNDLFHSGDVFTFDKYDHFLSKSFKETTTMDNGETFPYRITMQNVNEDEAIITIKKI